MTFSFIPPHTHLQGSRCVGFTLSSGGLDCWLYAWVPSLTATGGQGTTYYSKAESAPVHPPFPPSPASPMTPIRASVPGDILTDLQRAGRWLRQARAEPDAKLSASTYGMMIDACARMGDIASAESWLERMQEAGGRHGVPGSVRSSTAHGEV